MSLNNLKIEDGFIESDKLLAIKNTVINSSFPWYLTPVHCDLWKPCYSGEDMDGDTQFVHTLYYKDRGTSDNLKHFTPILDKLNIFSLIRVKINCVPQSRKRKVRRFHVDVEDENAPDNIKTSIYYLNTNNGETVFEKSGERVKSVANRVVTFPYNLSHAGTTHTNLDIPYRFVLNVNYI